MDTASKPSRNEGVSFESYEALILQRAKLRADLEIVNSEIGKLQQLLLERKRVASVLVRRPLPAKAKISATAEERLQGLHPHTRRTIAELMRVMESESARAWKIGELTKRLRVSRTALGLRLKRACGLRLAVRKGRGTYQVAPQR